MGLIGNLSVLNKSLAVFDGGTTASGAYAGKTKSNYFNPSVRRSFGNSFDAKTSIPDGYKAGLALVISRSSGDLATFTRVGGSSDLTGSLLKVHLLDGSTGVNGTSLVSGSLGVLTQGNSTISGVGALTGDLAAVSSLVSTISGVGSLTGDLKALVPLNASIGGSGTISSDLKGQGSLSALIEVGAATGLRASDVWTYDISSITATGTSGKKLNDASSGSNPWDELTSSHTASGTFGSFIQRLLTVGKFLGLKD